VARAPRIEVPGAIFHVYARGSRQQAIYRTHDDRRTYLRFLAQAVARHRWHCLTYCLMGNHVHLLIETPDANLGKGMQGLHGGYARLVNQRYGTKGALFESRYGCVRMENDAQLWMAIRYIARNPVEAGLSARAEKYEWSSYGAVVRRNPPPFLSYDRLLSCLSAGGGDALANYRDLVVAAF
jgi:REP element-mobilizing transposase RayT